MDYSQGLSLTQKQQLKLSPQLIQSFELMALPLVELQARIQTEIDTNPALEIPDGIELSFDEFASKQLQDEHGGKEDDYSDSSSYGSDEYAHRSEEGPFSVPGGYDDEASDRQQQFLEGAISEEVSLQEHLLSQLGCTPLTEEEQQMGLLVISNLDDNGFYRKDPATLVKASQLPVLNKVILVIRGFDPPGVCAKDFRESLVIQATNDGLCKEDLAHFTSLVNDHLEQMRAGKAKEVAKALDIPEEDLAVLYDYLRTLTPYPGQLFSSGPQQYVVPDLSIHMVDGTLQMQLNDQSLPALVINPEFAALGQELQGKKTEEAKEANTFIQHALRDATNLMGQVNLRNQTLQKVGLALIKFQGDFFVNGPKHLKPLTLKIVADEVGMHETTISRISSAKWIDTDWGIIPIKNLFSNAVATDSDDMSKNAVKEVIREIIEAHEGPKALSDQKLSDMLKERGISVARRTVAKYRGELNIDSSFVRGV